MFKPNKNYISFNKVPKNREKRKFQMLLILPKKNLAFVGCVQVFIPIKVVFLDVLRYPSALMFDFKNQVLLIFQKSSTMSREGSQ